MGKKSLERHSKYVKGDFVFSLLESLEFKVLKEENGKCMNCDVEQVSHSFVQILLYYRPLPECSLMVYFFLFYFF